MIRKTIGWCMLSLVFIVMVVGGGLAFGAEKTLEVFGIAGVLLFLIVKGVDLIS